MAFIPNHIIDQVIKGNDILQVVSSYVKLEKQGKNYFGLCPFHSEKTPSFSVSPEKQLFHCFSCGEGGNVAQFISKIDNIPYLDSIKKLASNINLNIDEFLANNKSVDEKKYYDINKFVCEYYQFALLNTKEGKKALDYLHKRNLTDDIISKFNIGLAPDSIDSLYQALKNNHFSELSMLELGHVIKSGNKYYDKFKNRIMFPITDEYNNIIGFSGRSYLDITKNEPKYINTQETPIFKKGSILYNLFQAKKTIKQNKRVFLFEGFMDVIAAYKSGLTESTATMGTALTDEHVNVLKRLTKHVVLCYDGDAPGIEATKKAIEILNRHNMKISVIHLPEGLDPDDYVNKYGSKSFIEFLTNNQKSYREYMYSLYFKGVNVNNIDALDSFKKKIFQLLIEATPTERELFINKLSNDIHVSVSTLQFDYNQYTQYLKKSDEPSYIDVVNHERMIKNIVKNKPTDKKLLDTQKILIFFCLYNRKFVNIINKETRITFNNVLFRRLFYDLSNYYNIYDSFNYDIFITKYINDDKEYLDFFQKIHNDFNNYQGTYEEKHLEQCFAVIVNELIANVVLQLKEKFKNSHSDEERQEITQEIVNQLKIIKVKK